MAAPRYNAKAMSRVRSLARRLSTAESRTGRDGIGERPSTYLLQEDFAEGSLLISAGQYVLGESITLDQNTHIFIEGDAQLNCQGHQIMGPGIVNDSIPLEQGSFAINLSGRSRLINCHISNFQTNVFAMDSTRIDGGSFEGALNVGLYLRDRVTVHGAIRAGNTQAARPFSYTAFFAAVYLDHATGSRFAQPLNLDNTWGHALLLSESSHNSFSGISVLNESSCGFYGVRLINSNNNRFDDQIVGGSNASTVWMEHSHSNNFKSVSASRSYFSVSLNYSNSNSFDAISTVESDDEALFLNNSNENFIGNVEALYNLHNGLRVSSSNLNRFGHIYLVSRAAYGNGMYLWGSHSNEVESLISEDADNGLEIDSSDYNTFHRVEAVRSRNIGVSIFYANANTLGTVKIYGRREQDICMSLMRFAALYVENPVVMLHHCHVGIYRYNAPVPFTPNFWDNFVDWGIW